MSGAAQAAWQALEPLGLFAEETPASGGAPQIPDDLTGLSERDLMALFRELTEWTCYAATQLADAWSDERQEEQAVALAVARAAVMAKTEKTVAAQKAVAAADPDVRDAEERLLHKSAYRRALEAVYNNCERRGQLVSRELSRRIARVDRAGRANRWGGA